MDLLIDNDVRLARVFSKVAKGGPVLKKVREIVRVVTVQFANHVGVVSTQILVLNCQYIWDYDY